MNTGTRSNRPKVMLIQRSLPRSAVGFCSLPSLRSCFNRKRAEQLSPVAQWPAQHQQTHKHMSNQDQEHPWQSSHDKFMNATMPKLIARGKEIGEAASQGNEYAKQIVSLYQLLYRSFDPITAIRLDDAISQYDIEQGLKGPKL